MNIWEQGILDKWSNKFEVEIDSRKYDLIFDVTIENDSTDADYYIEIKDAVGDMSGNWPELRPNADLWFTSLGLYGSDFAIPHTIYGSDNLLGEFAAHEFGHILGIYDEYKDGNAGCINYYQVPDLGTMGCWMELPGGLMEFAPVQDRYFSDFINDISSITGRSVAGSIPTIPDFNPTGVAFPEFEEPFGVPEPTTLTLMGLGLAGIGWKRRTAA